MTSLLSIAMLFALLAASSNAKHFHDNSEQQEQLETLHSQLKALHSVEDTVFSRLTKELETLRHSRTSRELRCGAKLKKFVHENCGDAEITKDVNLSDKCCHQPCSDTFIKTSLCPQKLKASS